MTDTTAGKWAFTNDDARHEAIVAEAEVAAQAAREVAEENARAQIEAAEAQGPVWHWVAFWIGLFGFMTLSNIFGK